MVAMVAVFGTMAADVLHVELGVPYLVSTVFFALVLAAVFGLWRTRGHPLDPWHRQPPARALLLGHGPGHVRAWNRDRRHAASTLRLGYLASGILFAVLFIVPALGVLCWPA